MSEPIRVLHVTYKMHCAGIEAFIMNLYRNIDRSKVQFDFLVHYTERQFYDDEIENLGGRIYRLSVREDNNFIKYFNDLKSFFSEHKEYKIVHAHMESFGMFYLNYAKKANIPVRIAHSHNDKVDPSLKGFIKNIMNKPFKLLSTDYMACSDASGKYLFGNKKYLVVKNAIDAQKFIYNNNVRNEVRKELQIENKFVVGHIGRFNDQKNHTFLIDIFNELHKINDNAVLLLLGTGELESNIKEKVKQLGLIDYVYFLGVRKDTDRLYQAMDVFVFPSLYEGLGIVGIESQASGLMTICSDGIPAEARITEYFDCLSLKDDPMKWAVKINKYSQPYERKNTYKQIEEAGFDVHSSAKKLEEYYLKKSKIN
ncbi:MAG: glycosyltransferase family 1 protein [Bacillota bacterium]|nr:glycosyltransferase family 1 protein [Bacillota bacterium]